MTVLEIARYEDAYIVFKNGDVVGAGIPTEASAKAYAKRCTRNQFGLQLTWTPGTAKESDTEQRHEVKVLAHAVL